jgi:hypothetical protein
LLQPAYGNCSVTTTQTCSGPTDTSCPTGETCVANANGGLLGTVRVQTDGIFFLTENK